MLSLPRRGVVTLEPKIQATRPHLSFSPRLLIHYICWFCPYPAAIPTTATCRGAQNMTSQFDEEQIRKYHITLKYKGHGKERFHCGDRGC